MIKIAFFDLDGTLAPVGKPMPQTCAVKLRRIRKLGVRVAVCSGKPVAYLNGFARQAGIKDLIMCGENGLTYQFGVDLPPACSGTLPVPKEDLKALASVARSFKAEFGDKCWYQPNEYAFTPFPRKNAYFPRMRAFLEKSVNGTGLAIYEHFDCFDVLPSGADKGKALKNVCAMLGVPPEEAAAVGDHINDHPMFASSGFSVGIDLEDPLKANYNVRTLSDALDLIIKEINSNG